MAGIIVFVVIGAGACVALIAAAIGVFISIVWVPLSLSPALSIAAINLTWTGVYQDLHWHPLFSIFSANIAGLLGFCLPWILTFIIVCRCPVEILLSVIVACSSTLWFVSTWIITDFLVTPGGYLVWAAFGALMGAVVGLVCATPFGEMTGRKDLVALIDKALASRTKMLRSTRV